MNEESQVDTTAQTFTVESAADEILTRMTATEEVEESTEETSEEVEELASSDDSDEESSKETNEEESEDEEEEEAEEEAGEDEWRQEARKEMFEEITRESVLSRAAEQIKSADAEQERKNCDYYTIQNGIHIWYLLHISGLPFDKPLEGYRKHEL